jgi:hypothetical protein
MCDKILHDLCAINFPAIITEASGIETRYRCVVILDVINTGESGIRMWLFFFITNSFILVSK